MLRNLSCLPRPCLCFLSFLHLPALSGLSKMGSPGSSRFHLDVTYSYLLLSLSGSALLAPPHTFLAILASLLLGRGHVLGLPALSVRDVMVTWTASTAVEELNEWTTQNHSYPAHSSILRMVPTPEGWYHFLSRLQLTSRASFQMMYVYYAWAMYQTTLKVDNKKEEKWGRISFLLRQIYLSGGLLGSCDGSSWLLSTWLCLELAKSPKWKGIPVRNFCLIWSGKIHL